MHSNETQPYYHIQHPIDRKSQKPVTSTRRMIHYVHHCTGRGEIAIVLASFFSVSRALKP